MAIQKTGPTVLGATNRPQATGPINRTNNTPKTAFEEALAKKSAAMGQPAAAAGGGAVDPSTGMTPEQSKFIEQTIGQQASRTILSMPKPKARAGEAEGGIDGE